MERRTKTISIITLKLTPKEARYLKGLIQNPLHYRDPDEEPEEEKKIRYEFWDALKDVELI